jgi:serine/threonine protein kinase
VYIVHGDIKPQNIFIAKNNGSVKLSDFMIPDLQEFLGKEIPDFEKLLAPYVKPLSPKERARLVDKMDVRMTARFGTPRYMPPEQWEGKVSVKTDIFTLGATLYEMLTNHSPMDLFKGIKPTKVNPFVPKWMEEVIITAMQPDPSARYYSVAEIESKFLEHIEKPSNRTVNFMIKEILMGDKIDIKMGDLSNISGQIFIGKFNEVVANLNNAGQTDFAEALKLLKDAVMASEHITGENKKEHIEVINQIGEEAAKEKPNKTLLKVMGDGLLSILKAIPDVAKAAAAVIPFLPH